MTAPAPEALLRAGIRASAAALAGGQVTARALAEAALSRIAARDGVLRCFIALWPEAARTAADRLDRAGHRRDMHLLAGLPVAHKDIFASPERQPSCGVGEPWGEPALPTSPALAAVRATGAVELGALNLAEFALGTTGTNAFFGNVGNPWNPAHCAGASSSGSGAAVGAGYVVAALGTDTGASCRVPASFCGVAGLKPTHEAVSTTGVFPLSWSLDTVGMLGQTADDCAILLAAAQGGPAPSRPAPDPAISIGMPRSYYTEHLAAPVAAAWEAGRAALERAGHRIRDVDVVETAEMRSLIRLIMRTEAAAAHRRLLAERPGNYPLAVRKFFAAGEGLMAIDYVDAMRLRAVRLAEALASTFAAVDVLLTPAVPVLPPRYDAIADAANSAAWQQVTLLAHYTQPSSFMGMPALVVPCALAPEGLPIGLQLIGRPGQEAMLVRAAQPIEAAFRALGATPPGSP
ncbi:MAG: amidase [Alphaproteobacteria bacterium]|nr:amidase [Alphaproteobacteria bacterium]